MRRKTSITTMIIKSLSAIYKLLFWEVSLCLIFKIVMCFHSSNSREGPATSATSLIFHRGYSIVISPVPECWICIVFFCLFKRLRSFCCLAFILRSINNVIIAKEFLLSKVWEVINSLLVCLGRVWVVKHYFFEIDLKYWFSVILRVLFH